jgi:RNA polymerase sigma factor (sigma-70 family)
LTIFQNDRALLDAFRRGEPEARKRVYDFYFDDVSRLVRLGFYLDGHNFFVAGIREIAQQGDIIQEVFVRSFTSSARMAYDGLRPFRPYLLRIAKNLMVSRSRLMKHHALTIPMTEELLDGAIEAVPSGEEASMLRPFREAAAEYLAQLEPNLRRFVALRFEEERSQSEAARELGLSRRNVRTMEERVRREFREHLRRRGLSPGTRWG